MKKGVRPEHFTEEAIRDTQINNFIKKIKLDEEPGINSMGARVRITMNDGKEFSETNEYPPGNQLLNPMTKDDIKNKFRMNVEFSRTVTSENAEELLRQVDKLEQQDNINKIIELLVA